MCDSTLLSRGEVTYNKNVFQQVVVYPNKSNLWQHRKVRFQSKRYRSANIKRKSKVFSCMGLKFTDVILQSNYRIVQTVIVILAAHDKVFVINVIQADRHSKNFFLLKTHGQNR
jgi:hypothetical protein